MRTVPNLSIERFAVMADIAAHDPDRRPADGLQLPARGWRINPRQALAAALLCWAGFAVMAALVETGRATAFDHAGLRIWRERSNLALPHGPPWRPIRLANIRRTATMD